jgi:NAD(P)-dependent dehydrogenase (short-subunit alcohol dehydrogenase family)
VLLENRTAIIYGAGGAIGRAVARAFAREGAIVHLTGRRLEPLQALAEELRAAGGRAEAAHVDALDEGAVDEHADAVAARHGRLDISMNVISLGDVHGTPLAEMALEDFERPVRNAVRTQFLTTRAAARHMIRQRSGVLLFFGGDGGRQPVRDYDFGGFVVALQAVEALRRQLAAELGRHDIRTITLHSGGIAETLPDGFPGRDAIVDGIVGATLLGRAATFEDVGNAAVFAASDHARALTATTLNISCGAFAD